MPASTNVIMLGGVTATGAGSAIPLYGMRTDGAGIQSWGTYTATIKLEVSNNGVDFVEVKAPPNIAIGAIATGAIHVLAGNWNYIRYNCSAYTSGTAYFSIGIYVPA